MALNDDVLTWGAVETARRIADRSITVTEAVRARIDRLRSLQPTLNIYTSERFDEAMLEAHVADQAIADEQVLGPLHGVPFTVKECFDVAGLTTNLGLTDSLAPAARTDAGLVQQLRQAGAILLAKTNVPQLMLYIESDNPRYGRTNNPWDVLRTCGGSTGGEAVACAVGASPLGVGSDMGGSLRVPAHFCGVQSFKPTSGRLSTDGVVYNLPGMYAIPNVMGFMARSVADLQAGMMACDPGFAAVQPRPWHVAAIASADFFPTSPAIRTAVETTVRSLVDRGCWQADAPDLPWEEGMRLFVQMLAADGGVCVRRQLRHSIVDRRLHALVRLSRLPNFARPIVARILRRAKKSHEALIVESTRRLSTAEYWQKCDQVRRFRSELLQVIGRSGIDLLVLPVFATPALPHGRGGDLVTGGCYSTLINLLDCPAGVVAVSRVRCGQETDRPLNDPMAVVAARSEAGTLGLPVGVQIMGLPGRDAEVLAAMRIVEQSLQGQADSPLRPWPREVVPESNPIE